MAEPDTVADVESAEQTPTWTPPERPRRWRWYHGGLVVIVAAITVMWLYAFSPLPTRKSPMRIDDKGVLWMLQPSTGSILSAPLNF